MSADDNELPAGTGYLICRGLALLVFAVSMAMYLLL